MSGFLIDFLLRRPMSLFFDPFFDGRYYADCKNAEDDADDEPDGGVIALFFGEKVADYAA